MEPEEKVPLGDEGQEPPRKPYVPPRLIVHGDVQTITGATAGVPIDAGLTGSA